MSQNKRKRNDEKKKTKRKGGVKGCVMGCAIIVNQNSVRGRGEVYVCLYVREGWGCGVVLTRVCEVW